MAMRDTFIYDDDGQLAMIIYGTAKKKGDHIMRKPATTKQQKEAQQAAEREYVKVESFKVEEARDTQYGVFLDLTINGIKIYGCKVIEGKEGKYDDFISFPQRKGTGRDGSERYFSIVWAPISPEDTKKIIAEVEKQLGVVE